MSNAVFYDFVTRLFIVDILKKCSSGIIPNSIGKYKYNRNESKKKFIKFEEDHLFLFVSNEISFKIEKICILNVIGNTTDIYIIPLPQPIGLQIANEYNLSEESDIDNYFDNIETKYTYKYARMIQFHFAALITINVLYTNNICYYNTKQLRRMGKNEPIYKITSGYLGQKEYYTNEFEKYDDIDDIEVFLMPANRQGKYNCLYNVFNNSDLFEENIIDLILNIQINDEDD